MRSRGRSASASILRSLSKPMPTSAVSSTLDTSTLYSSAEPLTTHLRRDFSFRPWERFTRSRTQEQEQFPPITSSKVDADKPAASNSSFIIPAENLKPGYQTLHNRFVDLINQVMIFSFAPPACTALWLFFTEQMLLESPVGMALLAVSAMTVTERAMQIRRVNYYTDFSVKTNEKGPSAEEQENQQANAIIAGTAPEVKFTLSGLKISGPIGDIDNPSTAREETLARIHALNRLVIPTCVMTPKGEKVVNHVHERWLTRLTLPFSIFNIIAILMKNPKDRRADDYIVLAAAAHNISDYLTGASVGAARHKFVKSLLHCETSKEVMQVLIDNRILNEGGMSFINKWLEHHQGPIGVRVGRTGSVVVYPYTVRSVSFGGPCPIRLFPQYKPNKSTQLSLPEPENNRKELSRK